MKRMLMKSDIQNMRIVCFKATKKENNKRRKIIRKEKRKQVRKMMGKKVRKAKMEEMQKNKKLQEKQ